MAKYKADLRVFGAIGFQDAPNGLWLGKQGYRPKDSLLKRIVDAAISKDMSVVGITSEDDIMISGSPEDRFGFLKRIAEDNQKELKREGYLFVFPISNDNKIIAIRDKMGTPYKVVHIINCETRHAPQGREEEWSGLKVHVVGGNCLKKDLSIEDTIKDANDRGYMPFLMGLGNYKGMGILERVMEQCTGVIGHDANNTFGEFMTNIPKIGEQLRNYSQSKNRKAQIYAEDWKVPSIAVSSAHWMHEIGRASISFETPEAELPFQTLRDAITKGGFKANEGHNSAWDVLKFGYLLGKHGGAPDRFKGDPSSSYTQTH